MATQAMLCRCGGRILPVESGGGVTIGWQCQSCHAVTRTPMPAARRREGSCPVCLGEFEKLAAHFALSECRRFYEQGLIWTRDRPAWAAYSELSVAS